MLRSIAYRAKNTQPVTMPLTSLLTSLQDASTKVLFGSDSGTGKFTKKKHHHVNFGVQSKGLLEATTPESCVGRVKWWRKSS